MTLLARATERGDRIADFVLERSTLDIARLLTLLLFILHGPKGWYVKVPLIILSITGILIREVRSSPGFWFTIAMFMLAHDIVGWSSVDNHKWLYAWWCIALGMTALAPPESQLSVIKINARLLIGLAMAFAVVWKLLSVDYLDGTFFKWELLNDSRFRGVAQYVGGMDEQALNKNRDIRRSIHKSFRKDPKPIESAKMNSGPRIDAIALAMTWWTIIIEFLFALSCLWPGDGSIARLRALTILVFIATTYLLAPVQGFGWMVIVLGFVQCPEQYRKLRASFLLSLVLIYLYRMDLFAMLIQTSERGIGEMIRFF